MSRSDNIDIFGEPWKLLNESEKTQAENLAQTDSELAADLAFAKSLSKMNATDLVGDPLTSDAVFLVSLRDKLEKPPTIPVSRWTGWRLWLSAATASILLFVGIYFGGERAGSPDLMSWSDNETEESLSASDLVWYEGIEDIDDLDETTIADYLEISEDSDLLTFDYESDEPVSDQLLELENDSI
ncbi:hypothetical protein KKC97_02465, partial [bacterium]|nr:hypothetical protein [bacterium]